MPHAKFTAGLLTIGSLAACNWQSRGDGALQAEFVALELRHVCLLGSHKLGWMGQKTPWLASCMNHEGYLTFPTFDVQNPPWFSFDSLAS